MSYRKKIEEAKKVKIEELVEIMSPFNAEGRKPTPSLTQSISEGWWPEQPAVKGSDGVLGDGHRRVKAAVAIGIQYGYVICSPKTSEELLIDLNKDAKRMSAADYAQMVNQGLSLKNIPDSSTRKSIRILRSWGLLEELCKLHRSPAVVNVSRALAEFLDKKYDEKILTILFLKQHLNQAAITGELRTGYCANSGKKKKTTGDDLNRDIRKALRQAGIELGEAKGKSLST